MKTTTEIENRKKIRLSSIAYKTIKKIQSLLTFSFRLFLVALTKFLNFAASRSVVRRRYLETKREMQLVVQEFRDNITRTYNQLKARHLKERKKLIRLIKQENEGHGLGMENNRVSLTPRARPVYFGRNDLGIMTINMNIFEMEEFSGSPTMLKTF